jgi:hypothetical protein
MTTIAIGNGNTIVNEGVLTGSTLDVGNGDDTITVAGSADTLNIGNGDDTINAGGLNGSSITLGNGEDTVTAGSNDTITVGNGQGTGDTITAGSNDTITAGNGPNTITAGSNDTITVGNGNNTITAGSNDTIAIGNGDNRISAGANTTITTSKNNDNGDNTIDAGANSTISLGNGDNAIDAGTSDTITIGKGPDTITYGGLTPQFSVPAALTLYEDHPADYPGTSVVDSYVSTVAMPITLLAPSLGNEVVNGFIASNDEIELDTADFANFTAVMADASQVGPNTVITQAGGAGTITLDDVAKSSLTTTDFTFFNGAATDTITITGVPDGSTLSAGTNDGGGTWTLTSAQLPGLTLDAGEPTTTGTAADLTVTVTNPASQAAQMVSAPGQTIDVTINPVPPNVSVSVLPAESSDPATLTRLQVAAQVDDPDGGNDYINRIVLSNVPTDVSLSVPTAGFTLSGPTLVGSTDNYTITTTGAPGTVMPEVDVMAPSDMTTNFNLGVQVFSDEKSGTGGPTPEVSSSTTQNISVVFDPVTENPDFTATNQSIWTTGTAFVKSFDKFLGFTIGPTKGSASGQIFSALVGQLSGAVGGSLYLKAGFEADLNVNSGSFNASLPFNVTLPDTYNATNDTLQIGNPTTPATESQAAGGSLVTTGAGGSFDLYLILDAMASFFLKLYGTAFGAGFSSGKLGFTAGPTNIDYKLFGKNSSTLSHMFSLPKGLGSITVAWPQVNTSKTNAPAGPISSSGTSPDFLKLNIDPIAVALDIILGTDPFKHTFKTTFGPVSLAAGYTLLAGTIAPGADLRQAFNLTANLPTGTVTPTGGSPHTLTFGKSLIIDNAPNTFSLDLTPGANLENDTSLGGTLEFGLRALEAKLSAGLTFDGSVSYTFGPLIHPHTTLNLGSVSVYKTIFPVAHLSKTHLPVTVT